MVGRRDAPMYHCGLCSDAFTSKIAYNRHMAAHEELEAPQWPCSVCQFKFSDSYALETHKSQTGHGSLEYPCNKCGKSFQTETKFKQHSQFPSPCYADASRTRPIRNASGSQTIQKAPVTTIARGRGGYVDIDSPVSVDVSAALPYGYPPDSTTRSSTPSNDSGVYCHDCKRSFTSEALYTRHCLSCAVQHRPVADPNATADAIRHVRAGPTRFPAGNTRPLQPQPNGNMFARLHQAPPLESAADDSRSRPAQALFPQGQNATFKSPNAIYCRLGSCERSFQSQAALAQHQKDSHHDLACGLDGCGRKFQSRTALDQHRKMSHIVLCDVRGCGDSFQSEAEMHQHKTESHSNGVQDPASQPSQSWPTSVVPIVPPQVARPEALTPLPSGSIPPTAVPGSLMCGIGGCPRAFRSEAGLNQHKADSHGVGGQGLDLHGRDSWMLSQNVRNQLREVGVLRYAGTAPQQPRGGRRAAPPPAVNVPRHPQGPSAARPLPPNPMPMPIPPASASNVLSVGGPAEIEQANELQGKIMRMLITADIAIQHDGKIVYDGAAWIRIGVARHSEAIGMIDELVHLRKLSNQGQAKQHVSHPTTFAPDFVGEYPSSDFEQLNEPQDGSLRAVTLCCSKILLESHCEEIVKIAAVDVLTGRPLMSYLVCTDPTDKVQDWRTSLTGLSHLQDFEAARLQRFKVLKGWTAARAALSKFVDQNTILLGYNLRSDLDALRIRHGRCVDLIKLVEKAAENRPLSKQQLRLETLLRDLLKVQVRNDQFGRDCLQDAFAVRGLTLWIVREKDKFVQYAKEKALDYQRGSI